MNSHFTQNVPTNDSTLELFLNDGAKTTPAKEIEQTIKIAQESGSTVALTQQALLVKGNTDECNTVCNAFHHQFNLSNRSWNTLTLNGNAEKSSEILKWLPYKEVLKGLRASGIIAPNPTVLLIPIIIALLSGASVWFLSTIIAQPNGLEWSFSSILKENAALISIGTAILGFILSFQLQVYLECHNKKLRSKVENSFSTALNKENLEALSSYLSDVILMVIDRPLAIIINDYSKLDDLTQSTLAKVMVPANKPYFGIVVWMFFEPFETELFIKMLDSDQKINTLAFGGNHKIYTTKKIH